MKNMMNLHGCLAVRCLLVPLHFFLLLGCRSKEVEMIKRSSIQKYYNNGTANIYIKRECHIRYVEFTPKKLCCITSQTPIRDRNNSAVEKQKWNGVFHLLPSNVFDIKYEMNEQPRAAEEPQKLFTISVVLYESGRMQTQSAHEKCEGHNYCQSLFTHTAVAETVVASWNEGICSFSSKYKNRLRKMLFCRSTHNKYKIPSHPLIRFRSNSSSSSRSYRS